MTKKAIIYNGEKIISSNDISDKVLVTKTYKELTNSTSKKQSNLKTGESTWIDISSRDTYGQQSCEKMLQHR